MRTRDLARYPGQLKTYQWIVRSNAGSGLHEELGTDPAYGECVSDLNGIFLQNNWVNSRWPTGSRDGGNKNVETNNVIK